MVAVVVMMAVVISTKVKDVDLATAAVLAAVDCAGVRDGAHVHNEGIIGGITSSSVVFLLRAHLLCRLLLLFYILIYSTARCYLYFLQGVQVQ